MSGNTPKELRPTTASPAMARALAESPSVRIRVHCSDFLASSPVGVLQLLDSDGLSLDPARLCQLSVFDLSRATFRPLGEMLAHRALGDAIEELLSFFGRPVGGRSEIARVSRELFLGLRAEGRVLHETVHKDEELRLDLGGSEPADLPGQLRSRCLEISEATSSTWVPPFAVSMPLTKENWRMAPESFGAPPIVHLSRARRRRRRGMRASCSGRRKESGTLVLLNQTVTPLPKQPATS